MANTTANMTVNSSNRLDSNLTSYPVQKAKKNSDVDKTDFIQMLVTQLKNQDPLDPMSNDRFAVDLATFSQLEQLISINEKVGTTQSGDTTSLAGFLGTEVTLNTQAIDVQNGKGGSVAFKLEQDAADVEVQLVDASGSIVDRVNVGALAAGQQTVELNELSVQNGTFNVQVVAHGTTGVEMQPQAYAAGTVVGYRPGADPKLLIGNSEYGLSDILEVRTSSKV
ncbi:MAG: hypothetical protein GYA55_12295 [SAR324 cluster bacterium]|uniref:Basal-body rod modification protein FlgD n=1 Tax=SAR324 cluster bacterium TaxID=2024889 RepID=A0A7X9FTD9_9DELT|nr:hypothetical protein [SAR324 cluster bacterium]